MAMNELHRKVVILGSGLPTSAGDICFAGPLEPLVIAAHSPADN